MTDGDDPRGPVDHSKRPWFLITSAILVPLAVALIPVLIAIRKDGGSTASAPIGSPSATQLPTQPSAAATIPPTATSPLATAPAELGTRALSSNDDITGKSEPAVAVISSRNYPSSLRIHCGSADAIRNNAQPTWPVGGMSALTGRIGLDASMPAAGGSTAYVYFMDQSGRSLVAPVAATLSAPQTVNVPLRNAEQLVIKCVSVFNQDSRQERLFDIFLAAPVLHP
jgi:hypothetical protein